MSKVYLITGASSDIGIGLIKKMYNKEDLFIAHYNKSADRLEALIKELGVNIKLVQADFTDDGSCNKLIREIKEVYKPPTHIIHLPATRVKYNKFSKISWKEFESEINVQLRSLVKITNAFIKDMAKQRYGKIVVVLTSGVINVPPKYLSAYITAKYAVMGFMKSIAIEYAEKNIGINAVLPSMIETKFLEEVSDIIVAKSAQSNPMGRNAQVEDIIPVIHMLLSEECSYLTGACIPITGGSEF